MTQVSVTSTHIILLTLQAFKSSLHVSVLVPKRNIAYERIVLVVLSRMISEILAFPYSPYFSIFPLCFRCVFTQALNLAQPSDRVKVVYLFLPRKEHSPVAMSHCACTSGPKFSLFL